MTIFNTLIIKGGEGYVSVWNDAPSLLQVRVSLCDMF